MTSPWILISLPKFEQPTQLMVFPLMSILKTVVVKEFILEENDSTGSSQPDNWVIKRAHAIPRKQSLAKKFVVMDLSIGVYLKTFVKLSPPVG
jgi:hypothetical protein